MAEHSIISASTIIRGNISGDGSLEILGKVRGDVTVSGDLVLGSDAAVQGNVEGRNVVIAGSVLGDVVGVESLAVQETGRIVGDLRAPTLGLQEGALVRGQLETEGRSRSSTKPAFAQSARKTSAPHAGAPHAGAPAAPRPPAPRTVITPKPTPRAESTQAPISAAAPAKAVKKKSREKAPPAPVVSAPKPGSRGRKKTAKR